jgi:uncharacterized protein (TIGR00369 family)
VSAVELPPYAEGLRIVSEGEEDGTPLLQVDFSRRVMGRPGFIHGGALSGLLEMAGFAALRAELARRGETERKLKPVNIAVEFMRGGTEQRTYAKGRIVRAGRRVAVIDCEAWQDDRTKPIALAQMKILISPAE